MRRYQSRIETAQYEHNTKIANLDITRDITKEKAEYEELTNKYELLEKEFVDMKSRLVAEKETLVEDKYIED